MELDKVKWNQNDVQECNIIEKRTGHCKNSENDFLFIKAKYYLPNRRYIEAETTLFGNPKRIKDIYDLKIPIPLVPCSVELGETFCYKCSHGVVITEEGIPLKCSKIKVFETYYKDEDTKKYELTRSLSDIRNAAEYKRKKLTNKGIIDICDFEKLKIYNNYRTYSISSTTEYPIINYKLDLNSKLFLDKNIQLLQTLSKCNSIKVNAWISLYPMISKIFDMSNVSYKKVEPTVFLPDNPFCDIHFGVNVDMKDMRILVSVLKEVGVLREIFINDSKNAVEDEIFIGSFYRYAYNRDVDDYNNGDIYGLQPDEFLEIPENIDKTNILLFYKEYSQERERDIREFNEPEPENYIWTEEDAWDAMTDGMYGYYNGDYDDWMDKLGY